MRAQSNLASNCLLGHQNFDSFERSILNKNANKVILLKININNLHLITNERNEVIMSENDDSIIENDVWRQNYLNNNNEISTSKY